MCYFSPVLGDVTFKKSGNPERHTQI